MLIETITFEIVNVKANRRESFIIENTIGNQEKVFTNRFTRDIHFAEMFDFQFARERHIPLEFINVSELENEIDETDEMVGVFA